MKFKYADLHERVGKEFTNPYRRDLWTHPVGKTNRNGTDGIAVLNAAKAARFKVKKKVTGIERVDLTSLCIWLNGELVEMPMLCVETKPLTFVGSTPFGDYRYTRDGKGFKCECVKTGDTVPMQKLGVPVPIVPPIVKIDFLKPIKRTRRVELEKAIATAKPKKGKFWNGTAPKKRG